MSNAIAAGFRQFRALAIVAKGNNNPCGACRQFMAEFSDDLQILLINAADPQQIEEVNLRELLPRTFRLRE